ncbi:MAG: alpha/beta hydrolase [Gammaproteobacteria bacterium]|nr:alpha/beta hydrolase [Gammaproteobacteria bacterium]MDH3466418.1 alpha/beta hydrolase [Gammaproteobacteria bacterium]
MTFVWATVITVLGLYALINAVVYVMQPRLVFFPTRALDATPAEIGLHYEDVTLDADDGVSLHGWFVPAVDATATVLFFHGNAGNISHRLDSIRIFHDLDLNVFILDYRGYGRSTGRPSETGTYADAAAAWGYLTGTRDLPANQIVLFGRSLGGAVATWLAAEHRPGALILESTFTSIPDLAAEYYPLLAVRWLARIRYDNHSRIARLTSPLLLIHSRDDELIRFAHAERLYSAAAEPKHLLEIHGGHNDGFLLSGDSYSRELRSFITHIYARSDSAVE